MSTLGATVNVTVDPVAAATLDGDNVITSDGEHVGKISDIMLDVRSGRVAYAVLSQGAAFSESVRPCTRFGGVH